MSMRISGLAAMAAVPVAISIAGYSAASALMRACRRYHVARLMPAVFQGLMREIELASYSRRGLAPFARRRCSCLKRSRAFLWPRPDQMRELIARDYLALLAQSAAPEAAGTVAASAPEACRRRSS
jgi:hypothetical protein